MRAFRYLRAWRRDSLADLVAQDERTLTRSDGPVAATLYQPRGTSGGLPAWILLHGITRPGRAHAVLTRFARSLAASGAAVLVPEVPEWVELKLAPDRTLPTVRAALSALAGEPRVRTSRAGLVGFSFGAPQAIRAGSDPAVSSSIAGIVGFGGYADIEHTLRFQFTGIHEWRGSRRRLRPDPYGRWVIAANYLTAVPGYGDAGDVADALRDLAREAGDRRLEGWDPAYDPIKSRLRSGLGPTRRALFDTFAPPTERDPVEPSDEVEGWVESLSRAARAAEPLIEPTGWLDHLPRPVRLLHGRSDRLIPFTETLRLGEALRDKGDVRTTVTRLFAHSSEDRPPRGIFGVLESARFVAALNGILRIV